MTPAQTALTAVALLSVMLSACERSGHESAEGHVRDAVRAQIEALKANDCDAIADMTTGIGHLSRDQYFTLCKNEGTGGITVGDYKIGRVTMHGRSRGSARVKVAITSSVWGHTNEDDLWDAILVHGKWKVRPHPFPN